MIERTSANEREHRSAVDVSVIIPMRDAESTIGGQLRSLSEQAFSGTWEVIIADNASQDGSIDAALRFSRELPSLHIVDAGEKKGPSFARNMGTYSSRGRLILYCDADDEVTGGWLEAMWRAFEVAEFLTAREDRGSLSGGPPDLRSLNDSQFRFLPWSRGGNIGIARRIFDEVGGWNEDRVIGEDVDFCWRVQSAGYKLHCVEGAIIRYRQPSRYFELAAQQFRFGVHAPQLYADWAFLGAPRVNALNIMKDMGWVLYKSPSSVLSRKRRRHWIAGSAGRLGRLVGAVKLAFSSLQLTGR